MKLKARNESYKIREVSLKAGWKFIVDLELHHIMLNTDKGEKICWSALDYKLIAPSCIKEESDFDEIIDLIAKTHGLNYQKYVYATEIPYIKIYHLIDLV
jgi:hypothetical protein